jgi:riboflavin kinase/FMN adenylyltransferase
MRCYRTLKELRLPGSACALGTFDGVHAGHRMVLESALRQSRLLNVPSVVFTFANHPQHVLANTPLPLLSSLEERLAAFAQIGIEIAVVLEFDDWLRGLTASEFIQQILVEPLAVRSVTVGYDFHFGAGRSGDGTTLIQAGERLGFQTQIIQPVRVADQIVSSTIIRKLLGFGDVATAATLLGRPYLLSGTVSEGFQRGRGLGFPTANLVTPEYRLVPALGTYGGVAILNDAPYAAVCNIGLSPTFEDSEPIRRMEVHLLDYAGDDFYGESLTFAFQTRLRDERKFASIEALRDQITADCEAVRHGWSVDDLYQNLKSYLPDGNRPVGH